MTFFSPRRRQELAEDAGKARDDRALRLTAFIAVAVYNVIGVLDIASTSAAIGAGIAEEANPILARAMEDLGPGWIAAKLFLQGIISAMVLWFPHRLVVGMFIAAILSNAIIVVSNFRILFGF